jgi:hypothetical protein
LPSPDSATEVPCWAFPTAPVPTSFDPCWVNCPSANPNEKRTTVKIRTDAANNLEDLKREIDKTRAVIVAPDRYGYNFTNCVQKLNSLWTIPCCRVRHCRRRLWLGDWPNPAPHRLLRRYDSQAPPSLPRQLSAKCPIVLTRSNRSLIRLNCWKCGKRRPTFYISSMQGRDPRLETAPRLKMPPCSVNASVSDNAQKTLPSSAAGKSIALEAAVLGGPRGGNGGSDIRGPPTKSEPILAAWHPKSKRWVKNKVCSPGNRRVVYITRSIPTPSTGINQCSRSGRSDDCNNSCHGPRSD